MRQLSALPLILVVVAVPAQNFSRSGINPEDMDASCKSCSDFWRYVNGGWLDKNPIAANRRSWGPRNVLNVANRERVQLILEAAAADAGYKPGSDRRKIGDLYASCMDTAVIDARGLAPLQLLRSRHQSSNLL
jgi:predicted metalloendopeptidase